METITFKLNRANTFLARIRSHVDTKLFKTLYSAIFESHLRYGCHLYAQIRTQMMDSTVKIRNKTFTIINFKGP